MALDMAGFPGVSAFQTRPDMRGFPAQPASTGPGMGGFPVNNAQDAYAVEVLRDAPFIYYKFDESGGVLFADSSGNNNTGVVSGGAVDLAQDGVFLGSNRSVLFTNANAAQVLSTTDPLGSAYAGALTFECFFNLTTLATQSALAARGFGNTDWAMDFFVRTDGSMGGSIVTTSTGAVSQDASTAINTVSANTPYHAVWRWTPGTGLDLFLNNVKVATKATATTIMRTPVTSPGLYVGKCVTPSFCAGRIDEAAWYTTALSDTRIAAHYAARDT